MTATRSLSDIRMRPDALVGLGDSRARPACVVGHGVTRIGWYHVALPEGVVFSRRNRSVRLPAWRSARARHSSKDRLDTPESPPSRSTQRRSAAPRDPAWEEMAWDAWVNRPDVATLAAWLAVLAGHRNELGAPMCLDRAAGPCVLSRDQMRLSATWRFR